MGRLEWFIVFSSILSLAFASVDALCQPRMQSLIVKLDDSIGKRQVVVNASDDTSGESWERYEYYLHGGIVKVGEDIEIAEKDTISDDVVAVLGNIYCKGVVRGDVVCVAGDIIVEGNGVIEGDASSVGGRVVTLDNGKVHGQVVMVGPKLSRFLWKPERKERGLRHSSLFGGHLIRTLIAINTKPGRLMLKLLSLVFTILIGWAIIAIARKGVDNVSATIRKDPFKAGLIGLVTLLIAGVVGIVFAITVIGIPIAIIVFLIVTVAMLLGEAALCVAIGEKWMKKSKSIYTYLAFGVILVYSVYVLGGMVGLGSGVLEISGYMVSAIGILIIMVVNMIGLGGVVLSRFGTKATNSKSMNSVELKGLDSVEPKM